MDRKGWVVASSDRSCGSRVVHEGYRTFSSHYQWVPAGISAVSFLSSRIVDSAISDRTAHRLTYHPGASAFPLRSIITVAINGAVPPNRAEAMLYEIESPV